MPESRVNAAEKMSVKCDSLSDAGIGVGAAKVVFGAKALSQDQVDGAQKSWESQVLGPDEPFEPSHVQSRFDATEKLCVGERVSLSDADADVGDAEVRIGVTALTQVEASDTQQ